jgi:hypothetical protein
VSKIPIGNIKGPKGDKGDAGPKGDKGDTGAAGSNTIPTNQAIAEAVTIDGPAKTALEEAIAGAVADAMSTEEIVQRPTGFPAFSRSLLIRRDRLGQVSCDYDMTADRPVVGVTYYTAPGASGAAAGTVAAPTHYQTAKNKADIGTLAVTYGEYFADDTDGLISKDINIVGIPDAFGNRPLVTGWANPAHLTWALHDANIYKATRTGGTGAWGNGVQFVIDKRNAYLTAWGDHAVYTKRATLAEVTGPGQWTYVAGELFVWALGNANLVTDASFMRASKAGFTGIVKSGSRRVYVERVEVQGAGWGPVPGSGTNPDINAVLDTQGGTVGGISLARDVRVRYCPLSGVRPKGDTWAAFQRVEVSSCTGDGIGYQSSGGIVMQALEIDCYGHNLWASDPAAMNINASTGHNDVRIVRINTRGDTTQGPIFADVNGAMSWNLRCSAVNSVSPSGQGDVGFQALNQSPYSTTKVWVEDCYVERANLALNAGGTTPYVSEIHTRRVQYGAEVANETYLTGAGSSITPY